MANWPEMSMCETCRNGREVLTARSRFLLCELSASHHYYPKYPSQPIMRCDGYEQKDKPGLAGRLPETGK